MLKNKITIPLRLQGRIANLELFGKTQKDKVSYCEDAIEKGESPYQIMEGSVYEYLLSVGYSLRESELISQSRTYNHTGYISPNIYVGTLNIEILNSNNEVVGEISLEVQSKKIAYRDEYKHMLEEIAEICSDLLLNSNSPISQNFIPNFDSDTKILYQRFAFINSILNSSEFADSLHQIVSNPATKWIDNESIKDIRSVKKITNSGIKQFCSSTSRLKLNTKNRLHKKLHSVPLKIKSLSKEESVDTSENRFIKHALITFQTYCGFFKDKAKNNMRLYNEASLQIDKLERYLSHSLFRSLSIPKTLPLNSPILQRKDGYREILRVWFLFELSSKLVWRGGNDVYSANKKDVAVLYEYWLFFKLLELVRSVFKLETKNLSELIKVTSDGLSLQIIQGQHTSIRGVYKNDNRLLNIEFSYNRTFSGDNLYPLSGSWTKSMRPDYTLSIWPFGISSEEAEVEELIVHIHFDAKYKVESISEVFGTEEDFQNEKEEQRKGTFKRADLLKMHSYKDAIRRTAGSYVLYPGKDVPYKKSGFHEIIPGLGAFSIRPSKNNNGCAELTHFIEDVVQHFMNRTSQRERISFKTYEVFKKNNSTSLLVSLPETIKQNRGLIPDETYVLIGFFKSQKQLDWIKSTLLYNTRTGDNKGSLNLGIGEVSARYLLLYTYDENITSRLYKIENDGPRIFSKNDLIELGYPDPKREFYLVYNISQNIEQEFITKEWDISKLEKFRTIDTGMPFCVTLTDLMKINL